MKVHLKADETELRDTEDALIEVFFTGALAMVWDPKTQQPQFVSAKVLEEKSSK